MLVTDSKGVIIYGLISALLHEFGHLFCMYLVGYRVRIVNFGFLNADIISNQIEDKKLLLILSGGCFVNFLLATIFGSMFVCFSTEVFKIIAYQNIGLGVFNLLPIYSLDGGQIFYLILKTRFSESVSLKILNGTSLLLVVPIFILGFYVIINSKYNFSLLLLSLYLISYILFKEDIF